MHLITKEKIHDIEVDIITVKQDHIQFSCMNYGAIILDIIIPDKDGKMENVVLKYNDINSYDHSEMYMNAIIGPTSGRIKDASFTIGKKNYQLDKNFMNRHNLHGGMESFAFQLFDYQIEELEDTTNVIFTLQQDSKVSRYPGNKEIKIQYQISNTTLEIDFFGISDQDTLLNMTSHLYFNLSGNVKHNILNHELFVNANQYLELNEDFIPTTFSKTKDTFLDFTVPRRIGERVTNEVKSYPTRGIDHPFILDEVGVSVLQAKLTDKVSKRMLSVYTTYPCIVIYTHNFPDGKLLENEVPQEENMAICFETQFEPNGIHIPNAHHSVLQKNQEYHQKTIYQFSIEE